MRREFAQIFLHTFLRPRSWESDQVGNFFFSRLDDRVIDIFDDTPLLSPYNLALVMGEIESLAETKAGPDKTTSTFWGDPKRGARGIYLLDKLDQIVSRLNDLFSTPYPLTKLDIVALPSQIVDNAGSPGLITMKWEKEDTW